MLKLWRKEEERLQKIVLEFVSRKLFSGSVLVHRGNRQLLHHAYGYADLEARHTNRADTVFHIGSMTKSFTATALLQAQELHLLSLSDPVSRYLPAFPRGNEIRIEHLLSNTAGLVDYLNLPIFEQRRHLDTPRALLIQSFQNEPLQFEPGSRFAYSNSNWILLGEIIERASGIGYAEFLNANIFQPLGMASTGYGVHSPHPSVAQGYRNSGGRLMRAEGVDVSLLDAAGALHSTIYDLHAFDWGLGSDTLLRPESVALMQTPYFDGRERHAEQSAERQYGYGWFIESMHGRRCVQHEGGLFGFVSGSYHFPEERSAIVLLSNVMDAPLKSMSEALAAELFGEPYELCLDRDAQPLGRGEFARYEGTFEGLYMNRPFKMNIKERDGRYLLELVGWSEFELTPVGRHAFFAFAKGGELEATFCEGASGDFDSIQMLWAGSELTVQRCATN